MPQAVDIKAALANLSKLSGRTPHTDTSRFDNVFAELVPTETGGVFAGSFDGESAWERHPAGDELVQVIEGATRLLILDKQGGEQILEMVAGMVTVVPRGHWHKFISETGVSVMTMTPGMTDHSTAARPDPA